MTESAYIIDVTMDNVRDVMAQSAQTPVLMDFWADWCEPCKVLMPILAKLAETYKGAFILAKINADQQAELAGHFGVRSLPTVKLVYQNQILEEFVGAKPESEIRAMLDKHLPSPTQSEHDQAMAAWQAGDVETARAMLIKAIQDNPKDAAVAGDLLKLLASVGDMDTAQSLIDQLPEETRQSEQVKGFQNRMKFMARAAGLPDAATLQARLDKNPADSEALYQLALHRIVQDDFAAAMDLLLELMRRDRAYGDDAGRTTLLELFETLGSQNPLVRQYRQRLFTLMHV